MRGRMQVLDKNVTVTSLQGSGQSTAEPANHEQRNIIQAGLTHNEANVLFMSTPTSPIQAHVSELE